MIGSTELQLILSTGVCVLAIALSWRGILEPKSLNFYQLIMLFVGIFFGLGSWTAFIYGSFSLPTEPVLILFETYLIIALYILALKLAERLSVTTISPAVPYYNNPFSIISGFYRYSLISWQPIVAVACCIWLLRIFLGMRFGLWFSGSAKSEVMLNMPYSLVVLRQISIIMMLGCHIWAAGSFWSSVRTSTKYTAAILLATEFFWAFMQGRRLIIMWVVFILFGFFASGRKLSAKYILTFLVVMFFIVNFLFPFFLSVRAAKTSRYSHYQDTFKGFSSSVVYAYKNFQRSSKKMNRENMQNRPLGLYRFIAQICEKSENTAPMFGSALLRSLVMSVPSAIVPAKRKLLHTEQHIQQHYNLDLTDSAITWPAMGSADFGVLGGFLAGIIVGSLIFIIAWWSQSILRRHPLISLALVGGLISNLIQVEEGPSTWWTLCRNIIVIMAVAKGLDIFNISKGRAE